MGWLLLLLAIVISFFNWLIKPAVLFIEPLLNVGVLLLIPLVVVVWLLMAQKNN
jgi:hypothetical protein